MEPRIFKEKNIRTPLFKSITNPKIKIRQTNFLQLFNNKKLQSNAFYL